MDSSWCPLGRYGLGCVDGPQKPPSSQRALIVWAKPAVFIWALDLMVQGADWTIYLTAAGVVALASVSVFGRPTFSEGGWLLDGPLFFSGTFSLPSVRSQAPSSTSMSRRSMSS